MDEQRRTVERAAERADGLTRRELLKAGAAGALLLGSGELFRAGAAHGAASAAGSGGVLHVGIAGGGPTDNFDAALINGPSATTRGQVFYETLVWLDGKFKLHNWLVEELTPNATATKWTARLRPGLEFHDGKTVTPEDVLFSMARLMNPKTGATAAAQLGALDLRASKKLDKRTVQFALKRPYSFFDEVLSDICYIIPVGYDPKKPVSTGPWKLVSY